MHRKEFLKTSLYLCAASSGFPLLWQGCKAPAYVPFSQPDEKQVQVKRTDFPADRHFVLLKIPQTEFPLYLAKLEGNQYAALLLRCTHKGCELTPAGQHLVCPCHGSEFDRTGKVLTLPADQNLQQFRTQSDAENITIFLR